MVDRYNVSCCETISKKWTPTAIDCYRLGCNCSKCNLYKIYFSESIYKCQMKTVVLKLVRTIGIPDLSRVEKPDEKNK